MTRKSKARSDEEIASLIMAKLADLMEESEDTSTVIACANALTRLLAVKGRQDDGDWMSDLSAPETTPNAQPDRNPPGH
jgi:hypothetical protein